MQLKGKANVLNLNSLREQLIAAKAAYPWIAAKADELLRIIDQSRPGERPIWCPVRQAYLDSAGRLWVGPVKTFGRAQSTSGA